MNEPFFWQFNQERRKRCLEIREHPWQRIEVHTIQGDELGRPTAHIRFEIDDIEAERIAGKLMEAVARVRMQP